MLNQSDQPTVSVNLTEAAIERILELRDDPRAPAKIRLYIQGGGCSGFEYRIEFAREALPDDILIPVGELIQLHVDLFSAPYLNGSTVDYDTSPFSSKFTFQNPQATSTCGCGSSFSI